MITKFIISKRNAETDSIYLKVADGAVLNIKAKSVTMMYIRISGMVFNKAVTLSVYSKLSFEANLHLITDTHIKYNNLLSKVTMTMRSIWVFV